MAELPNTLPADRSLYAQPTATQGAGRYRWYVLAVLTIAQGCHALDRSVIGLVLEPVKIEFGLTDGEAGVLAGLSYGIADWKRLGEGKVGSVRVGLGGGRIIKQKNQKDEQTKYTNT